MNLENVSASNAKSNLQKQQRSPDAASIASTATLAPQQDRYEAGSSHFLSRLFQRRDRAPQLSTPQPSSRSDKNANRTVPNLDRLHAVAVANRHAALLREAQLSTWEMAHGLHWGTAPHGGDFVRCKEHIRRASGLQEDATRAGLTFTQAQTNLLLQRRWECLCLALPAVCYGDYYYADHLNTRDIEVILDMMIKYLEVHGSSWMTKKTLLDTKVLRASQNAAKNCDTKTLAKIRDAYDELKKLI